MMMLNVRRRRHFVGYVVDESCAWQPASNIGGGGDGVDARLMPILAKYAIADDDW